MTNIFSFSNYPPKLWERPGSWEAGVVNTGRSPWFRVWLLLFLFMLVSICEDCQAEVGRFCGFMWDSPPALVMSSETQCVYINLHKRLPAGPRWRSIWDMKPCLTHSLAELILTELGSCQLTLLRAEVQIFLCCNWGFTCEVWCSVHVWQQRNWRRSGHKIYLQRLA